MTGFQTDVAQAFGPSIAALKRCATIVVFSSAAAVAADQPALVSAAKNVDREAVRALL